MLIVLSPAKTLDFESELKVQTFSQSGFLAESKSLISVMQGYTPEDISELMHVSPKIAELNFGRFLNWKVPFTQENARQAIFAFKGDVYTGLDIESYKAADLKFAQNHLRILSGLYGLLKPLDLIQAYRLEMGIKLSTERGKNLYEFWDTKITEGINTALIKQKDKVLINLASNEYFKVIKKKTLCAEIVTPVFKDYKNGQYKVISFFAKKARGLMASYIIKNRLSCTDELQNFDVAGYRYNEELSNVKELVFTRKQH